MDISSSQDPRSLKLSAVNIKLEASSLNSPSTRSATLSSTARDADALANRMRRERSSSAPPASEERGEIPFGGHQNGNLIMSLKSTGDPRLCNSWHRSTSFNPGLKISKKPNQQFSQAGHGEPQSSLDPSPPGFSPRLASSTRVPASLFDDRGTDLSLSVDASGQ
jgi:hypothetical protein